MRLYCFLFSLVCLTAHALTEQELQGFINEAIKAGGGEVVIPPRMRAMVFPPQA